MVNICAISDTHNHKTISVPKCDILLHSGDWTNKGTYAEVHMFMSWLSSIDTAKHKVCIAGNHDFLAQSKPESFRELMSCFPDIHYLQDSSVELCGLKIYGLPWSPFFYDWAFNALEDRLGQGYAYKGGPGLGAIPDKEHPLMSTVCNMIPEDTNILLCHSPPRLGNIDRVFSKSKKTFGEGLGSVELIKRIEQLPNLKAGFYGHIHSARTAEPVELLGATHYNACSCNEEYEPVYKPIKVKINVI